MTSPTQENCSLSAAQRASLANAHMDAEVELAFEDPEYRQSLHEVVLFREAVRGLG